MSKYIHLEQHSSAIFFIYQNRKPEHLHKNVDKIYRSHVMI